MNTAMDQDPEWKFQASPPPGAALVVMLCSIEVHLLSRIVVRVLGQIIGYDFP